MADADISFRLTLGKLKTQTLRGVSNLTFFHVMHITKWWQFLDFFIMADTDIPFLSTL